MRLVSICPSNTELVAYIGLQEYLVGTDNYSDWPSQVLELPKLGPDLNIDMDALEALNPDLVLASLSVPGMERNVEALKERGIPHIVLNPSTLDEIGLSLLRIGEASGFTEEAKLAYVRYNRTLESYRSLKHEESFSETIYWEWWPKPIFTPGGGNWLTELSTLVGLTNLFGHLPEASVKTDWDTVVAQDPDWIAMVWVGVRKKQVQPEAVMNRSMAKQMKAVRNGRILVLEEELFCRPSPRLLDGLERLSRSIAEFRNTDSE